MTTDTDFFDEDEYDDDELLYDDNEDDSIEDDTVDCADDDEYEIEACNGCGLVQKQQTCMQCGVIVYCECDPCDCQPAR